MAPAVTEKVFQIYDASLKQNGAASTVDWTKNNLIELAHVLAISFALLQWLWPGEPRREASLDLEQPQGQAVGKGDVFDPGQFDSFEEAMAEEPMYAKLDKMGDKLRRGIRAIQTLKGKDVVVVVGTTGAGKSTIANALIQGVEKMSVNDEEMYEADWALVIDGRQMFEIGHTSTSCTDIPGYFPLDDKQSVYLVDAAGFGDSNVYAEFPNQTLVHEVVKNARRVIFCLVIRASTVDSARGSQYLQMMTSVMRMLSAKGIERCDRFVLPIINNVAVYKKPKSLESALTKPAQAMREKFEAMKDANADQFEARN